MRIRTIAIFFIIALASPAQAATYSVTTTASSGPGSFRQAILDSNSPAAGDHTIEFSAGFPTGGLISLDADLPLINAQSLAIIGGSKLPTIDGQALYQMLRVSDGTTALSLSDLTLTRGLAPEKGGCINAGSGTTTGALQLARVTLSDCQASGPSLIRGGAISWQRSAGTGDAAKRLLDAVGEDPPDLLVVNTEPRLGLRGRMHGSRLDRLLKATGCPVLTLPLIGS